MKNEMKTITPLFFDISLISSLCILVLLPFFNPSFQFDSPIDFLFPTLAGTIMILSNKIKTFSYTGKGFYWFAINVMKPRTRFNHIIWGLFLLFFGMLAVFVADKPLSQNGKDFFNEVHSSYEYWITIIVVLLFNILAGIYTAKKYKEK